MRPKFTRGWQCNATGEYCHPSISRKRPAHAHHSETRAEVQHNVCNEEEVNEQWEVPWEARMAKGKVEWRLNGIYNDKADDHPVPEIVIFRGCGNCRLSVVLKNLRHCAIKLNLQLRKVIA